MIRSEAEKRQICRRLGIPFWRDAESYPAPKELSLKGWRWEFLRRNKQYRKDFEKPEQSFKMESKERYFEDKYLLLHIVDPLLSVRDISTPKPPDPKDVVYFGANFDVDVQFLDHEPRYVYAFKREVEERLLRHATESHLFLRVDLQRPLRPQFARLLEFARIGQSSWGTKDRRPRQTLWPIYLRALDARAVGESYSAIAKGLPTNTAKTAQHARDVVERATALCSNWPY